MPLLTNKSNRSLGKVTVVKDVPLSEGGTISAIDNKQASTDSITAINNFYDQIRKPFITKELGVAEYSLQSNALLDYTNDKRQITRTTPTQISIQHVATGKTVFFPAFLKTYSETFSPSYSSEDVYGRMDPLMSFQKTSRTIALGWQVPAYSAEESELNLSRLSSLAQFMYPTYKNKGDATLISKPPLLRIRFANLIQNAHADVGLLCAATNFSFNPNIEMGFFTALGQTESKDAPLGIGGALFPKSVDCTLALTVLHEHDMGHSEVYNLTPPESPNSYWLGNDPSGSTNPTEYPWGRPGTSASTKTSEKGLITLKDKGVPFIGEVSFSIDPVEVPIGSTATPSTTP